MCACTFIRFVYSHAAVYTCVCVLHTQLSNFLSLFSIFAFFAPLFVTKLFLFFSPTATFIKILHSIFSADGLNLS